MPFTGNGDIPVWMKYSSMGQIQNAIDQSKFNFETIHTCIDNNSSLCFDLWKMHVYVN